MFVPTFIKREVDKKGKGREKERRKEKRKKNEDVNKHGIIEEKVKYEYLYR